MNFNQFDSVLIEECKKFNFPEDPKPVFVGLRENPQKFALLANFYDAHQNRGNDLLLDRIARAYYLAKKNFYPTFQYKINKVMLDLNKPRLCLSLHSNFSPLTALMINRGCKFAVLSDFPETLRYVAYCSGIQTGDLPFFPRGNRCLLIAKNLLKKNYLVSATIDFRLEFSDYFGLLSDGLLKLALATNSPTLFGMHRTNNLGEIEYITADMDLNMGIDAIKSDLITFISQMKIGSIYKFSQYKHEHQIIMLNSDKKNIVEFQ